MKYNNVISGKFISRPNRFIAEAEIEGAREIVHVKNTGRCRELLIPGCRIFLAKSDNPSRKTAYDLIGTEKTLPNGEKLLINMDSQAPNSAVNEWLKNSDIFSKDAIIRRETVYGSSRFDFYVKDGNRKAFIEVKGVTLEKNGIALFPDAPTERGIKHLNELTECLGKGYEAYIIFVIQMKDIHTFMPNDSTHAAFGDALRKAQDQGVHILAYDCIITTDSMTIDAPVKVML